METIKNYLENLFARLPRTEQMRKIKQDLLENMLEKYEDYKAEGMSENEAIGRVITEFGNIDELLEELGITPADSTEAAVEYIVDKNEAEKYVSAKTRAGKMVGAGVFSIIFGVASLIFFNGLVDLGMVGRGMARDSAGAMGLLPMFLFIAAGVALFIFSELHLTDFNKLFAKSFSLSNEAAEWVDFELGNYLRKHTLLIALGVVLCILAPLLIIFPTVILGEDAATFSVIVFLITVAIAVWIFVYSLTRRGAYERLLKVTDPWELEEKDDDLLSGIMWPLAVIIFLLAGFLGHLWHIAWIVFPITALLQAIIGTIWVAKKKRR